ncbi:hypothetical protein ACFPAF_16240 [Hymenobacter endophyticus]|uniref:Uncharacterized protein n=1 Tax=Hymenobacter endophyticus TaxID=3076335 RepID=A0ABU3TKU3_9BACT|nr:hypothetical protein [Hymenobacter endophyticus]MDU0371952.1 hypothetical protein [Hymenobacter endophyticus]
MTILLEEGWQTDLGRILPAIRPQIEELNWIISNLECWHLNEFVPMVEVWQSQMEHYYSYAVVSGKTLYDTIANQGVQVVWGVFCGITGDVPNLTVDEVPYADGNRQIWTEPEVFQLAASEIEIIAFDSTFTQVKFRDESLGYHFLRAFPEGRIIRTPDDLLTSHQ